MYFYFLYLALPLDVEVEDLIDEDATDTESEGEDAPSKNFAILLVEKFIYEDPDQSSYLETALSKKGKWRLLIYLIIYSIIKRLAITPIRVKSRIIFLFIRS